MHGAKHFHKMFPRRNLKGLRRFQLEVVLVATTLKRVGWKPSCSQLLIMLSEYPPFVLCRKSTRLHGLSQIASALGGLLLCSNASPGRKGKGLSRRIWCNPKILTLTEFNMAATAVLDFRDKWIWIHGHDGWMDLVADLDLYQIRLDYLL